MNNGQHSKSFTGNPPAKTDRPLIIFLSAKTASSTDVTFVKLRSYHGVQPRITRRRCPSSIKADCSERKVPCQFHAWIFLPFDRSLVRYPGGTHNQQRVQHPNRPLSSNIQFSRKRSPVIRLLTTVGLAFVMVFTSGSTHNVYQRLVNNGAKSGQADLSPVPHKYLKSATQVHWTHVTPYWQRGLIHTIISRCRTITVKQPKENQNSRRNRRPRRSAIVRSATTARSIDNQHQHQLGFGINSR